MLLGFVFLITGLTLYQEHKTERALDRLRDLASPRALVIRDGAQRRIPGREVVRDDLLLLAEGDRVPADAVLLTATNLSVDESLLTGESVPVRKAAADGPSTDAPPGWRRLAVRLLGHARGSRARPRHASSGRARARSSARSAGPSRRSRPRRRRSSARRSGSSTSSPSSVLLLCILVAVIYALSRGQWLEGSPRRPDPRHGHHAERVPGGPDPLPLAGRLAALARCRSSPAASRRSRPSGRPRCCAWTRPGRSPSTRCRSRCCSPRASTRPPRPRRRRLSPRTSTSSSSSASSPVSGTRWTRSIGR